MRKKWMVLLFVLLVMLAVAGCGKESAPPPVDEQEPELPDDGSIAVEMVDPISVIINNHAAARPHSGLQQARIVYEFLVEGGITRLMAVYDQPQMENFVIGPVRSLRPYFAEAAMEHAGVVAFSGTSGRTDKMIEHLALTKIVDYKYFWRDDSRKAPHNLYTDIETMYGARGQSAVRTERVMPQELPAGEEALEFKVTYSGSNVASYKYNIENKMYMRFENGEAHVDRETGLQYGATRVIVRTNEHVNVNVNGTNLVDIDVSGSGTAMLYEAG
ncbi:MAG: DUF3048 domain-containing protein, partial [Firmicutes bacterium]|nr:DUF3048 domain-containing protein [Bacillota bacterium]